MSYLDELHRERQRLLLEHKIYDVDSYGWLNENDVDAEFVGYAMWTLTPPYEQEWLSAQHRRTPSRRASPAQQRLVELGEDFQGLMKAARYQIGMAIVFRADAFRYTGVPNTFEFHILAALTTLVMAYDRARDFVILAVTDEEARPWKEGQQIRTALNAAAARGLSSEVAAIRELHLALERLRTRRNEIVHTIALDIARIHRLLLQEERDAFESGTWNTRRPRRAEQGWLGAPTFDDTISVDATLQSVCDSYQDVIKVGDLAYRIENFLRQSTADTSHDPASG